MSRMSFVLNVLLAVVVGALAWALYARTHDTAAFDRLSHGGRASVSPAPGGGPDADARLAGQLARIDARLALLESGTPLGRAAQRDASPAAPEMPAAEADRRLGMLLPSREIDPRELARFHARLAGLPPADRFALSAALSRAINDRRIRFRP